MNSITYIVVVYNSMEDVAPCLSSIICSIDVNFDWKIFVVDNSDIDKSRVIKSLVEGLNCDKIIYFHTGSNLGYGSGNNYAARKSDSDLICIVNPDVRLPKFMLSAVLRNFTCNKNLGLLGFRQKGGFDISFYFYPQFYFPFITSFLIKLLNKLKIYSDRFCFPSGACVVLDKKVFDSIGGYDENFFLYCEDADLSARLLSAGHGVRIDFSIQYQHLIDVVSRKYRSEKSIKIERNSFVYYMQKHMYSIYWSDKFKSCEIFLRRFFLQKGN